MGQFTRFQENYKSKEKFRTVRCVSISSPWKEVGYKTKVETDRLYLESWENLMRSPCITYIYTMMNVFIIELKQFVFCNVRTLMLMWWSSFESADN